MDTNTADPRDVREPQLSHDRVETLIIGAGQAGLSVAYHLAQRGRSSVIVDSNARVGDNWRRHYDSLRLYSAARHAGLPGMSFPGDPRAFPTKNEVAEFLETYVSRFGLDVRGGTTVDAVTRRDGHYVALTSNGTFDADNVVIATGTFGRPYRPPFATDLDPAILQLHSSDYKSPSQLRPGPVLVVGASHSGADVAVEVAPAHPTILCGPSRGEIPFELEGRVAHLLFPVVWFLWGHLLTIRTPIGRKIRNQVRSAGGPLLRYRSRHLADAGVERVTDRVVGAHDGKPVLADGRVVEVANVVWCTGFRHDFAWIDLPVIGEDGWPSEQRGVVDAAPGLYFTGLAFQFSFRSMLIGGAGHDGAYIARHIAHHRSPAGASVGTAGSRGGTGPRER